jgi:integrase/recombinase XerD
MNASYEERFKHHYQSHLKHLKLKGLQPKTIEAYARALRRIGAYFDHQIDALSEQQLVDYFTDLLSTHSWGAVKLDLYGLKFYYTHVLRKPWGALDLIKPPKAQRLPDIVTVEEAGRLFQATHTLSYRVFYFTLYSLGLRLGEGLRLQVGDIDAERRRVHIRDAKGNNEDCANADPISAFTAVATRCIESGAGDVNVRAMKATKALHPWQRGTLGLNKASNHNIIT